MTRILRLCAGCLLLFSLALVTVRDRCRILRHGFEIRQTLRERARLSNENQWIRGAVARLKRLDLLAASAQQLHVRLGSRSGPEVWARRAVPAEDGQ